MRSLQSKTFRRVVAVATLALAGGLGGVALASPHGGPGMVPLGGRGLQHMLESVDATPEQRARIEEIAAAARADMKAQREASRGLREQAMTLFAQDPVDPGAMETLRANMLAEQDRASQRVMQAMVDVGSVLTVEQRQKLVADMQQRGAKMRRHMHEGAPDRGGR